MSSRLPARRTGLHIGALAGAIAAALVLSPIARAAEDDLVVKYDQSQLLRLPQAVSEIIIGNPSIADVTVQSGNMLVVTGKTFGITNVIVLDGDRNVIREQRVVVIREDARVVNLHKGGKRESYSCTPNCNPNLVVGDDRTYFETVNAMNTSKTKFSDSAADNTGASSGNQ